LIKNGLGNGHITSETETDFVRNSERVGRRTAIRFENRRRNTEIGIESDFWRMVVDIVTIIRSRIESMPKGIKRRIQRDVVKSSINRIFGASPGSRSIRGVTARTIERGYFPIAESTMPKIGTISSDKRRVIVKRIVSVCVSRIAVTRRTAKPRSTHMRRYVLVYPGASIGPSKHSFPKRRPRLLS
jgi:hypothetical protein